MNSTQPFYATLISTIGCDRLPSTKKHLESIGIEFREDLQPSERRAPDPNQTDTFALTRWEAFTYKQTHVNAITTRRHLEVLQYALDNNLFPHLIMEDDVRFTSKEDFTNGFERAMKTRYPWLLFLFSCVTHPIHTRIPLGFSKLHYVPTPLMAHAYLIEKEGAEKLLKLSVKYDGLAYDKLFRHLGRCISLWPEVAYQYVNPHQLQAIIRRESGGEWLLTMSEAIAFSLSLTFILIGTCLVINQIRKKVNTYMFTNRNGFL